ncbi:MAG: hypothetical protein JRD93_04080, partial [Deltaproteobacteria bacterium]|nr:hypothetical protein [Deltaproteobacteria bacterium]
MNQAPKNNDKVVYVVVGQKRESINDRVGQKRESINDRVAKILTLRSSFDKMILVSVGNGHVNDENIMIKPFPNPFGILRLMGLQKLKKNLDKYFFFPSRNILYVKAVQKKLKKNILNDLKKGKKVSLLTCLPPHDLALIGLFIKRQFPETYWIVDWQDLWSYDENYFQRLPQIYRERLLRLEKEVLDNCDMNVTTNLSAKEVLEKRYDAPS